MENCTVERKQITSVTSYVGEGVTGLVTFWDNTEHFTIALTWQPEGKEKNRKAEIWRRTTEKERLPWVEKLECW